jgi:hypothetical protein
MAVSAKWFGNALLKALNKEINWSSDTIKVMLCTSAYTPDQDAHIYKSSVTNEVVGTGYTAGGATLGTKTINYTAGSNLITLDAADTSWTSATITARYAVIYDSTPGTDATDPLLAFVDFGQDIISTNGTFTISWNASGILTITAA